MTSFQVTCCYRKEVRFILQKARLIRVLKVVESGLNCESGSLLAVSLYFKT